MSFGPYGNWIEDRPGGGRILPGIWDNPRPPVGTSFQSGGGGNPQVNAILQALLGNAGGGMGGGGSMPSPSGGTGMGSPMGGGKPGIPTNTGFGGGRSGGLPPRVDVKAPSMSLPGLRDPSSIKPTLDRLPSAPDRIAGFDSSRFGSLAARTQPGWAPPPMTLPMGADHDALTRSLLSRYGKPGGPTNTGPLAGRDPLLSAMFGGMR